MPYISNYNPVKHDIYTFNGTPTLPRTNPPGPNCLVKPTGLNSNNVILDPKYKFPEIDWSGLHVRDRGFISYGWNDPADTFRQFWPRSTASYRCYTQGGCSEQQWSQIQDYNYWNNGLWALVLISPKHLLATDHYVGPNLEAYVQFIGKDGTVYPLKRAKKVAAFVKEATFNSRLSWYTDCVRIGDEDCDLVLFELDEELTETELQNIHVYPIVKPGTIHPNRPIFTQDPNGKIRIELFLGGSDYKIAIADYPLVDENIPIIQDGGGFTRRGHVGDSGSPALMNINGKTCILTLIDGGLLSPILVQNLKTYVKAKINYDIEIVDGGYVYSSEPTLPSTTPLTSYPYLSRFSTKESTLNYDFVAFRPNFNLQASELNEIQEIFFTQQSKTIEMVHNWFGNKLIERQLSKGPNNISNVFSDKFTNKDCMSTKWSTVTPVRPDGVHLAPNNTIQADAGWYFLKNECDTEFEFKLSAFKWVYLPINYTFTEPESGKYTALSTINSLQQCFLETQYFDPIGLFLQDNTYTNYDTNTSPPCGANRMVTQIDTSIVPNTIPLPTTGATISNPILFYKDADGKAYLPNGYEIKN